MKNKIVLFSILVIALSSCGTDVSKQGKLSSDSSKSVCNHNYVENVIKEPTIIENGLNEYRCDICDDSYQKITYDLSQYVFEDGFYMYDGNSHDLTIKGMIPYGTSVEYENNSLMEIGQKEVTAKIYNEKHELIDSKKAMLNIIENKGFPNIYIDTNDAPIEDKENYVPMTLSTTNCDEKYEITEAEGEIRLRGNGTLTYDKKAYRIKMASKMNILGLNNKAKAKSWVLIADYADQSMMRNATAYYMGNSLLNYSSNYCSDYMHVNVYLNDSYNGVYLLAEQQQANANRVNVNEASSNYTGTDVGYLLELDYYANEEDYYFEIGNNFGDNVNGVNLPKKAYSIKTDVYSNDQVKRLSLIIDIKGQDINVILDFTSSLFINKGLNLSLYENKEIENKLSKLYHKLKNLYFFNQMIFLGNVYSAFMKAVKGDGLDVLDENNDLKSSPYDNAYDTLNSMIDLESVFKMYVLHEMMKNVDVGYSSFYMFVDFSKTSKYPRLTFGAPWDFDWSSGNVNESPYTTYTGEFNSTSFNHMNPWFYLLSKTNFFKQYIKKYYRVYLNSGIFDGAIAQANYEADAFASEFAHNYERWQTLGTIIYRYTPDDVKSFKVHKDAVNHLIKWLNNRKTAVDKYFGETK